MKKLHTVNGLREKSSKVNTPTSNLRYVARPLPLPDSTTAGGQPHPLPDSTSMPSVATAGMWPSPSPLPDSTLVATAGGPAPPHLSGYSRWSSPSSPQWLQQVVQPLLLPWMPQWLEQVAQPLPPP
jgi:hypothetical protein